MNFPLCDYNEEKLKNIKKIQNINGNSFYKIFKDDSKSQISSIQNILVIKCVNKGELNGEC